MTDLVGTDLRVTPLPVPSKTAGVPAADGPQKSKELGEDFR